MLFESLSPPQAIDILLQNCRQEPTQRIPIGEAKGLFLSENLKLDTGLPDHKKAKFNGYALPEGFSGKEATYSSVALDSAYELAPIPDDGLTQEIPPDLPKLIRVETGQALPQGYDRVLSMELTEIVGTGRLKIKGDLPETGFGIEEQNQIKLGREIPKGTRVSPRLMAQCLSVGQSQVEVRSPNPIALASIGNHLVDATLFADTDSRKKKQKKIAESKAKGEVIADQNGFWIEKQLQLLDWPTKSYGILENDPEAIGIFLARLSKAGHKKVILTGGLGTGIEDRTIEALKNRPYHIFFSNLNMVPGQNFLYAHGQGMEVIILSGAPLDAACCFDMFVVPYLFHAQGMPNVKEKYWSGIEGFKNSCIVNGAIEEYGDSVAYPPLSDPSTSSIPESYWVALALYQDQDGTEYRRGPGKLSRFQPSIPNQHAWLLEPPVESKGSQYLILCHDY